MTEACQLSDQFFKLKSLRDTHDKSSSLAILEFLAPASSSALHRLQSALGAF
jgi:hypothetical protein